jgi:hypothetical protein
MTNPLQLPDHEVFISSVELEGLQLRFRIVCDYHPESDQAAYIVVANELPNLTEAFAFLDRCKSEGTYVYIGQSGGAILLTTEPGDELHLAAKLTSLTKAPFNEAELSEALLRVWQWHVSENNALRSAHLKIHTALAVLDEAERRIEIKSSHHQEGTAAVLYAQQLALIRRIRDELGT